MNYYNRLKMAREDRDITQLEAAKAINTTFQQIYKYESGKQEMTVTRLMGLCLFYDVSADYILGLPKGLKWDR